MCNIIATFNYIQYLDVKISNRLILVKTSKYSCHLVHLYQMLFTIRNYNLLEIKIIK